MAITFDPAKRTATLRARQLDFADAEKVFAGDSIATFEDDRFAYGEATSRRATGGSHGHDRLDITRL